VRPRTSDVLSLAAVLALAALAAYLYSSIPEAMPVHWNVDGEIDGYAPRFRGIATVLLLPVGVFALLRVLPSISPIGFRIDRFRNVFDIIVLTIMLALCGIGALVLLAAAGSDVPAGTLRPLIIGGIFVVIGNFLGKVRRNFFVGIRTPWTLASDEVWVRTHRLGGWLFVLAGIAVAASAVDPRRFVVVLLAAIGAAAILSVGYSLILYWKLHGFRDV
jgi:uncharacterized membrane protein